MADFSIVVDRLKDCLRIATVIFPWRRSRLVNGLRLFFEIIEVSTIESLLLFTDRDIRCFTSALLACTLLFALKTPRDALSTSFIGGYPTTGEEGSDGLRLIMGLSRRTVCYTEICM